MLSQRLPGVSCFDVLFLILFSVMCGMVHVVSVFWRAVCAVSCVVCVVCWVVCGMCFVACRMLCVFYGVLCLVLCGASRVACVAYWLLWCVACGVLCVNSDMRIYSYVPTETCKQAKTHQEHSHALTRTHIAYEHTTAHKYKHSHTDT